MRTLVSVRAEHDHGPRPPVLEQNGHLADTACWRRRHASIKSRQTSPTGDERQTNGSQALARPTASMRVSSPPVGTFSTASDVTDDANQNSKPRCDSERPACADARPEGHTSDAP